MKNTKHTENLDNSTPQEITSQSKRKILTSIGVSSGILGASALSQQWTKPIVNSIILPAHAQSTPMMTTMMMTTMGMSTTKPAMDDMDMTTMMPTTATPAPVAGIVLSPMALGVIDLSGDDTTRKIAVRLATEPRGVVSVTAPGTTGLNDFTTTNWEQDQVATVVMPTVTRASMADEKEAKVTFTAAGGGYDDVKADLTYTGGYFVNAVPTGLKATAASGMVRIEWTKPATNSAIEKYIVQAQAGSTIPSAASGNILNDPDGPIYTYNVMDPETTSHSFDVVSGDVYSCMVTVVYKAQDTDNNGLHIGAAAGVTTSATA